MNEHHLGPFCIDQQRELIYFTRSGLPELGTSVELPWIYSGKYDILHDEVSHIKPIGSKIELPLFEIIVDQDEEDIRNELKKLQKEAEPDEKLIAQVELYLQVINMGDMQLIMVVDSLFEAGELSGSLIKAINEHIESKGDPVEK